MFGSKREKAERLRRISRVLRRARRGMTQAELSRQLGVSRSTVNKDLAILQKKTGTLLWEDDEGRLHLFE